MADLEEAVDIALDDRYALGRDNRARPPKSSADTLIGLRARMNRIMKKFGGDRRAAARATGIPYSSWNHALGGRNISAKNRNKIVSGFAALVTSPARARKVKRVGLPSVWSIGAVVVGDPDGSRYINGYPAGTTLEDLPDDHSPPAWRYFNAEGLDSGRIVDAWLTHGAGPATDALLDEIEQVYGTPFGFEGDHVDVAFHHRQD